MQRLGYTADSTWETGRSWINGDAYIVLKSGPAHVRGRHERLRSGMNHLALWAGTREEFDALVVDASRHGWSLRLVDEHPHAGGPDTYAAYLEDAAGFEVELVAEAWPKLPMVGASPTGIGTPKDSRASRVGAQLCWMVAAMPRVQNAGSWVGHARRTDGLAPSCVGNFCPSAVANHHWPTPWVCLHVLRPLDVARSIPFGTGGAPARRRSVSSLSLRYVSIGKDRQRFPRDPVDWRRAIS